jgi:hypothetical protein
MVAHTAHAEIVRADAVVIAVKRGVGADTVDACIACAKVSIAAI